MTIRDRLHSAAFLPLAGVLAVAGVNARAAMIGPGPVTTNTQDTAFNLMAVDLSAPATLGPGNYNASLFEYMFTNALSPTVGSITPVVLTGGGSSFTPVAVGSPITYTGPTSFISTSFGGSGAFTLGATTTVYGGVYWSDPGGSSGDHMPLGFNSTSGSAFIRYSSNPGVDPGATAPTAGTPISGGLDSGTFTRAYDFSIQVVPEPSSLALLSLGALGLVRPAQRRRDRAQINAG